MNHYDKGAGIIVSDYHAPWQNITRSKLTPSSGYIKQHVDVVGVPEDVSRIKHDS